MKTKVLKHRFSLIELLTVVGIIMILMGIGIGVYSLVSRKTRDSACKAMIAKMAISLENYKAKAGYYLQTASLTNPSVLNAASALYIDPYSNTDYTINREIDIPNTQLGGNTKGFGSNRGSWLDPWGTEFRYQCPGTHNPMSFDLYSMGSDKIANTADDLTNWNQ